MHAPFHSSPMVWFVLCLSLTGVAIQSTTRLGFILCTSALSDLGMDEHSLSDTDDWHFASCLCILHQRLCETLVRK